MIETIFTTIGDHEMVPPCLTLLLLTRPEAFPPLSSTHARLQANPVVQAALVQQGRTRLFFLPVQLLGERTIETNLRERDVCVVDLSLSVDVSGVLSYQAI